MAELEQCCRRMLSALQYCRRRPQPPGEEPDTGIRQPLCSKEGLSSSMMTNGQSPCHPLHMRSEIDNPVRHAARRGETGRIHLLNEARAWPTKINKHATPDTVCHVMQGRRGKKGGPRSFKGPSIPWYFPLSPICNPCSPLVYKREGRAPH